MTDVKDNVGTSTIEITEIDPSKSLVTRDEKGRFVKGYSGNPAGKPKGIKHRSTQIKQLIDASMADMLLDEFIPVMEKAIQLAKKGDRQMIKLLLNDLLSEVRKASNDDGNNRGDKYTQLIIENLTLNELKEQQEDEYRSKEGITIPHQGSSER